MLLLVGFWWWMPPVADAPSDWRVLGGGDRGLPAEETIHLPAEAALSLAGPAGIQLQLIGPATLEGLRSRPRAPRLLHGAATVRTAGALDQTGFSLRWRQGRAAITGTRFSLLAEEDRCLLGVTEGQVQVLDGQDRAAGSLTAGEAALVDAAGRLLPAPLLGEWTAGSRAIDFGQPGSQLPGFAGDNGATFDRARGYGWLTEHPRRARNRDADLPGTGSFIVAGSNAWTDRWECILPNGRYQIEVACGDSQNSQGPHYLSAEGRLLIDGIRTAAGAFHQASAEVTVSDGRLSLILGIAASSQSVDGDMHATDTALCYLIARRLDPGG